MKVLRVAVPAIGTVGGLLALKLVGSRVFVSPEKTTAIVHHFGMWGPPLFVLFLGVRPLLLLPGQALAALAGMLWGGPLGTVIALAGSALSTLITYTLGSRVFRNSLERISGYDRRELEGIARHYDLLYAIIMAMNPLIPTDICIVVGAAAGARLSRLALGAVIGSIPGTIATASFGSALAHGHKAFMGLTIAGWAASLVGGFWIARNVTRTLKAKPRVRRSLRESRPRIPLAIPEVEGE